MAEQFLSRLTDIEKRIAALEDMLKRMVMILSSVNEIRSEVKIAKEEILRTLGSRAKGPDEPQATEEVVSLMVSELQATKDQLLTAMNDVTSSMATLKAQGDMSMLLDAKMGALKESLDESLESFKMELFATMESRGTTYEAAFAPTAGEPSPIREVAATVAPTPISVPADKGMRIADELDKIVDSLRMGCIAGDVLEALDKAKTEIMRIVPSDAIMVKIDRWAGIVGAYSKRHQIQAKDIREIKKEIRDEVPKYRPA